MRIVELSLFAVRVPLKREVRHAAAARSESENLLARCRLADGSEGWGEGVPREYVTGETIDGAFVQLAATALASQFDVDCSAWDDVLGLCERFQLHQPREDPRRCYGNAPQCAVELSILDAFGRLFREPLSAVTHRFGPAHDVQALHEHVRYSTTIAVEGPRSETLSALKMRLYGFHQCKVKVGSASAEDGDRLRRIRRWIGPHVDLRVDANGAWHLEEAAARLAPLLTNRISCVEQPVPHEEVGRLAEVRCQVPVPFMLDESLTSVHDARHAILLRACDLFNIRLSKCGGFLNSLRIAALVRKPGWVTSWAATQVRPAFCRRPVAIGPRRCATSVTSKAPTTATC